MVVHLIQYIESTPELFGGRSHIAGRRIAVHHIVVLHEMHHWTIERIAAELDLTLGEVYAALSYYHDHREQIDSAIREAEALADRMEHDYPSRLQARLSERRANLADSSKD